MMAAAVWLAGCGDLASRPDRVPWTLQLLPADTSVLEGESVEYRLKVLDKDGAAFDRLPSWAPPTWSVSDPAVASVSADGQATALGAGREARVRVGLAQLSGGARLRVNPRSVTLDVVAVHLTQAVQTLGGDVPLIAGRPALLRAFVTGDRPSFFRPRPLATFYRDGEAVHQVRLDPPLDRIPVEVDEGRGDRSFNGTVPGWVLQPGVRLVVDLDPEGIVPAATGSELRFPAFGQLALDVRTVPPMALTVVPVLHSADQTAVLTWVDGMTATSPTITFVRSILPIGELEFTLHEPYRTSADLETGSGWFQLLREMSVLRLLEGERGYYYGALALPPETPFRGLGWIGRPPAIGDINLDTFAHELGHSMGLRHAPCGGASNPDVNYPYEDGSIGAFGFETRAGNTRIVDPSEYWDLMTYCDPSWISDYHFVRALNYRRARESLTLTDGPGEMLLLWGSAGEAELLLEPAFVIEAPPKLPEGGPYRLEGFDGRGRSLFSLAFTPVEVEFGGGQFAFAVPYESGWGGAGGLDRIRLSGPEGSVTLPRSGGHRVAFITDPGTGRLRGMLRGAVPMPDWAAGLDFVMSDGIPGAGIVGPGQ